MPATDTIPDMKRRAELWARDNLEAIRSSNHFVEQHGLPLAKYRQH